MKPETISALAALVSALSAAVTAYLYRKQGKGFIWTKDPKVEFGSLPDGKLYLAVEIPLFNLGTSNIRFKRLKTKKIYLKTNMVDPFEMEMDEAYFPPGVEVIKFKTPIYDDDKSKAMPGMASQIRVHNYKINPDQFDSHKYEETINAKISEIGEVLFILECDYKDGSWFGFKTITTTIAMELKGIDLSYLSPGRRKALNKLFN